MFWFCTSWGFEVTPWRLNFFSMIIGACMFWWTLIRLPSWPTGCRLEAFYAPIDRLCCLSFFYFVDTCC
jgi:hypothetical protein